MSTINTSFTVTPVPPTEVTKHTPPVAKSESTTKPEPVNNTPQSDPNLGKNINIFA